MFCHRVFYIGFFPRMFCFGCFPLDRANGAGAWSGLGLRARRRMERIMEAFTEDRLRELAGAVTGQDAEAVRAAETYVDSLAAPMSLINSLIVAIAMRRKREMESTLVKLEKIWDANNVYEKGGE